MSGNDGDFSSLTVPTMWGAAVPRAHETGFAVAVQEGFGVIEDSILELRDRVLPEMHRRMSRMP